MIIIILLYYMNSETRIYKGNRCRPKNGVQRQRCTIKGKRYCVIVKNVTLRNYKKCPKHYRRCSDNNCYLYHNPNKSNSKSKINFRQ